jgi:prepilin-type N-terminal cleavage/methylation domain-containing protein
MRGSFSIRKGAGDRDLRRGFTLVELLVVIAILMLLLALLTPSLVKAKFLANAAKAKVEMAGIGSALLTYYEDQQQFPPSRTYCEYGPPKKVHDWGELPVELARGGYCAAGDPGTTITVNTLDPFNAGRTYKYLHPGKGYHNNASTYTTIWAPDNFPGGDGVHGTDYSNDKDSPVSFVLFSLGTAGDIGYWNALALHEPLNTQVWLGGGNNYGLIVRAYMKAGTFVSSP